MDKCLVSGSYDPITNGHLDIIRRVSNMFDTVIVGVFNNEEKEHMFNLNDMLYEVCVKNNITHIVRGFRDNKDYAYETEMAVFNFEHCGVMTCLLPSNKALDNISSSKVRELLYNIDKEGNRLNTYINDDVLCEIRRIKNARFS